jgi:hypothetical protein
MECRFEAVKFGLLLHNIQKILGRKKYAGKKKIGKSELF